MATIYMGDIKTGFDGMQHRAKWGDGKVQYTAEHPLLEVACFCLFARLAKDGHTLVDDISDATVKKHK